MLSLLAHNIHEFSISGPYHRNLELQLPDENAKKLKLVILKMEFKVETSLQ